MPNMNIGQIIVISIQVAKIVIGFVLFHERGIKGDKRGLLVLIYSELSIVEKKLMKQLERL